MNFLQSIINWVQDRRRRRHEAGSQRAYVRGYDWAAGLLLRGEAEPITVQAYTEPGLRYSDFDRGADAAVDRLVALNIVEDNRI